MCAQLIPLGQAFSFLKINGGAVGSGGEGKWEGIGGVDEGKMQLVCNI